MRPIFRPSARTSEVSPSPSGAAARAGVASEATSAVFLVPLRVRLGDDAGREVVEDLPVDNGASGSAAVLGGSWVSSGLSWVCVVGFTGEFGFGVGVPV